MDREQREVLSALARQVTAPDPDFFRKTKAAFDAISKPLDGLGSFETLYCRIASILGQANFDLSKKALLLFCADNGVVAEGISQSPKEVTRDVAVLMGEKRSTVGVMTSRYGLDLIPVDIGIDGEPVPGLLNRRIAAGSKNLAKEPAMTQEECLQAIKAGMELVKSCKEQGYRILATGEMGIGNTTSSTALLCACSGESPERLTGAGAGLSQDGIRRKKEVIRKALALHGCDGGALWDIAEEEERRQQVFHALCCLGGFDIAGLVGAFLGGALYHMPMVIDGLISAVAALTAMLLFPGCEDYFLPSHAGRESGVRLALAKMGLTPVIGADMALGEGTGAVMLLPLLDMVEALFQDGTRFAQTQIDAYERFEG